MIDPCGTPARNYSRANVDHLEQLFVSADFKKSVKIFKTGPPIPFCSNL